MLLAVVGLAGLADAVAPRSPVAQQILLRLKRKFPPESEVEI
jgi:hypothetical protein